MAADKRIAEVKDLEVKELNRRRSGEAFEVILKHVGEEVTSSPLRSPPPPKKEASIDQIQFRMQAAEERRRAMQEAVINQVKAEEEKVLKVKQKKAEVNTTFASSAEERLKNKMSLYEENYESALQAKIEKFRAMNMKPEELKEKFKEKLMNCVLKEVNICSRNSARVSNFVSNNYKVYGSVNKKKKTMHNKFGKTSKSMQVEIMQIVMLSLHNCLNSLIKILCVARWAFLACS